jgi:ribonucleoside-diphosphate reductase alpha chain
MRTKKIKIKDLRPGMKIKSYDKETNMVVFCKVEDVWKTNVHKENQRIVKFENRSTIFCSANHPIIVKRDEKITSVLPDDLLPTDHVLTENGLTKTVSVEVDNRDEAHYDISVEGTEVFFAQTSLDEEMILTHNCSQGGVRGGAATIYYPLWHYEVEDLLVLKNNKGTEENRVRHMDYGVQFNKLMYERLITGGDITLFSPKDVPGLYDAFFADQNKFRELYEAAERNPKLRKKTVKAIELFSSFMEERKSTGRIYLQNVDNANDHGSFIAELAPIRQSNLCAEIDLPTKPLNDLNDPEGEISLCTLSAINWGNVKNPADFEKICTLAVRGLDALLSYQDYPVLAARLSTEKRRPLGVGIINFAYWMAKHGLSYQDIDGEGLALIDEWAEAWSYYLIKASADLAKEQGAPSGNNETKYSLGITPNQTYKKDLDGLVPHVERMDWGGLRAQLRETGIRNSTLMALMPSETSSQIANATNGVEPPRSYISVKQSKHGVLKQVVPEYKRLKNKYDLLWDQKSPEGYLKIMAVLQKYIDQGISVNTSYNPIFFEDEKIPMSVMLQHLVLFYKLGGKQLYYFNTNDGAGEIDVSKMVKEEPVVEPTKGDDDEYCESCAI